MLSVLKGTSIYTEQTLLQLNRTVIQRYLTEATKPPVVTKRIKIILKMKRTPGAAARLFGNDWNSFDGAWSKRDDRAKKSKGLEREGRWKEKGERISVQDLRCTRVMICGGPDPDPVCLEEAPTLSRNRVHLVWTSCALRHGSGGTEKSKRNGGESRAAGGGMECSRSVDPITPRV